MFQNWVSRLRPPKTVGTVNPMTMSNTRLKLRPMSLAWIQCVPKIRENHSAPRLWRRYGEDAFGIMELIKKDKSQCEPLIPGTGIRRCEIEYIKESEMIVELEDFLRRRSKLALIMDRKALKESEDLKEICKTLFGDDAELRYERYFSDQDECIK